MGQDQKIYWPFTEHQACRIVRLQSVFFTQRELSSPPKFSTRFDSKIGLNEPKNKLRMKPFLQFYNTKQIGTKVN